MAGIEPSYKVLIVDDESAIRDLIIQILEPDFDCHTAGSAEEALNILENESFDLVMSDINMGGMSGIELIPKVLELWPDTVIMVLSGNSTIDSAIGAIRGGAFDYIKKPFNIEHVRVAVDRALEHRTLIREKRLYENNLEELVKKRTDELNYLSYYDVLTTLPNRSLFEDRLSQSILLKLEGQQVALLFVALDNFKKIRDTLGHDAGDLILQEAAHRLVSEIAEGSTVARFERDEFAILLPQVANAEEVVEIASWVDNALRRPYRVKENEIFITASIGISLHPEDGKDSRALLKHAASALLSVQESGGDSYSFYADGMNAKALRQLTFESDLRNALDRGEFEMYYQPKLDIRAGKIVGMEALIRWHHPEHGAVSPAEFIPLAEATGFILPIGEWILYTACSQGRAWQKEGHLLSLSVNLSACQFSQPDLAEKIISIVKALDFDCRLLDLEVTESTIMKNPEKGVETLKKLQALGIKISLDDFGTGYSSLSYLKRLPIDILKIDKSFIDDVTENTDDAALVEAIIALAHNLKLKVIAEGVEREDQLQRLYELDCDEWQGFLFSKPLPAKDFRDLLDKYDRFPMKRDAHLP
jgi:diguanylate cyclase (GGDEF)-like protein